MIHAYSEFYLSDAKKSFANMLDYAVYDCGIHIDKFAELFVLSGFSRRFETGDPSVLSGISGTELAQRVLRFAAFDEPFPPATLWSERTPAYWTGWSLAEYQWYSGRRFKDIFDKVSLSEVLEMYRVYHEMDISRFIEEMERRCRMQNREIRLKSIRENRGLSQSALAKRAGVSLRSIQMYEQQVNDIDKAQGKTLYRLAHVLGCSVEDLLENPMGE